jgi:hypothetical protein
MSHGSRINGLVYLAAETLSLIEIEILDHLGYHRKAIKRPLSALQAPSHRPGWC